MEYKLRAPHSGYQLPADWTLTHSANFNISSSFGTLESSRFVTPRGNYVELSVFFLQSSLYGPHRAGLGQIGAEGDSLKEQPVENPESIAAMAEKPGMQRCASALEPGRRAIKRLSR